MSAHTIPFGKFLFDYLYGEGARAVFGIPGDFALPAFRWLSQSELALYTMTHEPSVGFAADGYSRVSGQLGVACVTYCVGGLNMLNSIACAYAEKSPVLVISGGPSPGDRSLDPLLHHKVKSFDTQARIFAEVTCASAVLLDPERACEEVMRVVQEVKEQCRPGYIEVPYDLVDMPVRVPAARNTPPRVSDAENLEACVTEAVARITHAKRPVIVADVELHRHGLTDLALEIAHKFNIPVASTLLSKSVISEADPLYIGVYSGGLSEAPVQEYVENSDCVMLLGAFITDIFLGLNTAKLERRNTLLFNTEKTRIGFQNYENVQFRDVLEGIVRANIAPKPFENPNPMRSPAPLTPEEYDEPLDAESFFRIFGLALPPDATVACDTGDALLGAMGLRLPRISAFMSDAYYLSMGFAVPAAIGAMAASPAGRVYAIVGDGAFQMTGIELSTAAKYGMKPVVCVLNNDGYGTQRHIIDGPFNNIHRWDYAKLPELLRYGRGVRVHTKGELHEALTKAAKGEEMQLIEVILPRDDCSRALRRMGEKLSELRDAEKRG